jgi:hypothetical protein
MACPTIGFQRLTSVEALIRSERSNLFVLSFDQQLGRLERIASISLSNRGVYTVIEAGTFFQGFGRST